MSPNWEIESNINQAHVKIIHIGDHPSFFAPKILDLRENSQVIEDYIALKIYEDLKNTKTRRLQELIISSQDSTLSFIWD